MGVPDALNVGVLDALNVGWLRVPDMIDYVYSHYPTLHVFRAVGAVFWKILDLKAMEAVNIDSIGKKPDCNPRERPRQGPRH